MAKADQAYTFLVSLTSGGALVSAPTLATGDVKVKTGTGAFGNIASLPTTSGTAVAVTTSAGENSDSSGAYVAVQFIDQTDPKAWDDLLITYELTTNTVDDLSTSTALTTHDNKIGTPSNLGSGATVAFNMFDVEADTAEIGTAGAGLTNIDLPNQTMDIVGNITGNLSGSVGSVTGAVGSVSATTSADIVSISGDGPAADNLELDYDGTGYTKANSTIGTTTANADMRGTDSAATAAALATHDGKLDTADANIDSIVSTLVTGILAEPNNETLIEQLKNITAVIEHQRLSHTHQPIGSIFYVDPVNGDTHANGNRGGVTDPYLTIQDCHDNAVTDSNHDLIMLLSGAAAGATTHTVAATTTISKRYTFIRGPGRDFIITRTGNGDTLEVTADGVEFSGFQLETAGTGSGHGIQATDADFLRVQNVWINATRGDGVNIVRGDNCQIKANVFTDTGQGGSGEGVHIRGVAGSSNRNHIEENVFHQCAGDGILIEDGTTNQTFIHHNTFEGCTGYGINLGASSSDAFLAENHYGGNTSGDVNDGGTDTIRANDEEWAKHSIATELRLAELDAANMPADIDAILADTGTDGVLLAATATSAQLVDDIWDEVLTAATHNVSTSSGRRVRQLSDIVILDGTSPDTGGTANTAIRIELNGDASANDGAYDPAIVTIVEGTGAGQSRQIFEYDGANKYAYINRDWKDVPDNTSIYIVIAHSGDTHVNEGLATGGGNSTITLNALASSVDDTYVGQNVFLFAGTGQDQSRTITAYNGTSKVATLDRDWETNPAANATVYGILPTGDHVVVDANIDLILADTNELQTDWADGGRLDLILDSILVMLDDPRAEPGQGAPGVNPDAMTKLDYLYKSWRNKKDNDGSTTQLYADDGSTVDQKQTTSEAAGTVTKAEWETGA